MGSQRLPGKILLPLKDSSVLGYLVSHLKTLQIPIIVATTVKQEDDVVEDLCNQYKVLCFRGSSEDVLGRYSAASDQIFCDTVVRLTADCPLHDPQLIHGALDLFFAKNVEYLSNTIQRTFPRGYDIEIFSKKALQIAANEATSLYDKEHVTPYIIRLKDFFSQASFQSDSDESSWRLTLDTKEDYTLLQKIVFELEDDCSYGAVSKILSAHPEWKRINSHVVQKGGPS